MQRQLICCASFGLASTHQNRGSSSKYGVVAPVLVTLVPCQLPIQQFYYTFGLFAIIKLSSSCNDFLHPNQTIQLSIGFDAYLAQRVARRLDAGPRSLSISTTRFFRHRSYLRLPCTELYGGNASMVFVSLLAIFDSVFICPVLRSPASSRASRPCLLLSTTSTQPPQTQAHHKANLLQLCYGWGPHPWRRQ